MSENNNNKSMLIEIYKIKNKETRSNYFQIS